MSFRLRTLFLACLVSGLVGAGAVYLVQSQHVAELDRTIDADKVAQDTARAYYRSELARLGGQLASTKADLDRAVGSLEKASREYTDYRAAVGRVIANGEQFARDSLASNLTSLDLVDRCIDDLERYLESLDSLRRLGGQAGK